MKKQYYYGRQYLDHEDWNECLKVLKSDYLSQGPILEKFESTVAKYFEVNYCVAVSSATAALHLGCRALGINEGDTVWTTSLSFVATANAIRYCGAKVEFIDIDDRSLNLSIKQLNERLKDAKSKGTLPKAVIPVHFAGQPCEMGEIKKLSKTYSFKILEDASQAMGATYNDTKIGECKYSDITVFSLHPVKSITTGEGGLILTNSEDIYMQALSERAHGIEKNNSDKSTPPWVAEMLSEGFNYKITEIQCSLGLTQLKKLKKFIVKRNRLSSLYRDLMKGLPVTLQEGNDNSNSAWHLMVLRFDFESLGIKKDVFYNYMKEKGINLSLHYYPIHLHSFYRNLGFKIGSLPNTENYYEQAFTFPLHVSLEDKDVKFICSQIKSLIGNNNGKK